MNQSINRFPFDFSPKLIKFLGEELIHDKKIAIMELVKNAYDADADKVWITIRDDEITIEDNGHGMTEDIIRNSWLRVGNSTKAINAKRSPKYKRLPIGEKGIGRLGVHRLGKNIQVTSKAENSKEVYFEIDWNRFEKTPSLGDLEPIVVVSREYPEHFIGEKKYGTKLVIRDLKNRLEPKDIRLLNVDLLKLLPPFAHAIQENFKIMLNTKDGPFEDTTALNIFKITQHALFQYRVVVENAKIEEFEYNFYSPNESALASRTITKDEEELRELIGNLKGKYTIARTKLRVGRIIFEGYIFDQKYSGISGNSFAKEVKDYLQDNGGIRVYRDGMRIYNYGEGGKDNDILDLDRKRAKRLGDNIGYNQLLASIELDREKSKDLVEKTNREGFVNNDAFASLQSQLDFCMEVILQLRKRDRADMDVLVGKKYDKADIDTKIKKIVGQVERLPITDKEKSKLKNDLYAFSQEFEQLKDIFLTASNTGLNLTFIIHEVDKIIVHLAEKIKAKDITQINNVFIHLKDSINAYKDIIRLDKKRAQIYVPGLIDQALFNATYRLESHAIAFTNVIDQDLSIIGKKGLILGIFTNLFDNSIYWLEYYRVQNKKIHVHAYKKDDDVYIVIADNGKGFNISFDAALRPFISGRIDEGSMGIGLHLAEQVMIAHEGSISHADWEEENLPEEFSQGAIIKLRFKQGSPHVI